MIIIIDTHTDICHHSKFQYKAASFIGVHRNTIRNWIKGNKKSEKYNHLKIYLQSEEL